MPPATTSHTPSQGLGPRDRAVRTAPQRLLHKVNPNAEALLRSVAAQRVESLTTLSEIDALVSPPLRR